MSALSIYKPGQGYWTRVLTAVGAAVLVLAGVGWLWAQMQALGTDKTTVSSSATAAARRLAAWGVANAHPVASLGSLRRIETLAASPVSFRLTDAAGKTFDLDAAQLQAALNQPLPGQTLDRNELISRLPSGAQLSQGRLVIELPATFAARNRIYIQAITAVAILAFFGLLIFWLLNKPNIVDFMIATEAEMRKVNWPTRREIAGSTWIVICGTMMMALLLLVVDVIFAELFIYAKVLQGDSIIRSLFSGITGG